MILVNVLMMTLKSAIPVPIDQLDTPYRQHSQPEPGSWPPTGTWCWASRAASHAAIRRDGRRPPTESMTNCNVTANSMPLY